MEYKYRLNYLTQMRYHNISLIVITTTACALSNMELVCFAWIAGQDPMLRHPCCPIGKACLQN